MEQQQESSLISVKWRNKTFQVGLNLDSTLKDLGDHLCRLTNVKADTMRLIVPSDRSSRLLYPFSGEHSLLKLKDVIITETQGRTLRMLGVPEDEVNQLMKDARADWRVAGFDEEEKRMRQRVMADHSAAVKLPQGQYIFCDFRTLHIPGIQLIPPPSEALRLMHKLAADPGIVAIMNKHHWHVGIMTEMAPIGYVGVSPKCILGFNKNHGEEISLRLRTDDLKGFRKYESIKKTLLHELAHMIHSEHDADFFALDKQLNEEAATLDWTKSRSHTLSSFGHSVSDEADFNSHHHVLPSGKLGGNVPSLPNARASSVAAAYHRLANATSSHLQATELHVEPDPDDHEIETPLDPDYMDTEEDTRLKTDTTVRVIGNDSNPEYRCNMENSSSPDTHSPQTAENNNHVGFGGSGIISEPGHDEMHINHIANPGTSLLEPDPDETAADHMDMMHQNMINSGKGVPNATEYGEPEKKLKSAWEEPDPDASQEKGVAQVEPDPDYKLVARDVLTSEPDPDDEELQRVQDPVSLLCNRLQKGIEMLRSEISANNAAMVLSVLLKIIRNVIEHPDETKFRRLRKTNPVIQRNVVNYKAAVEILHLVGFAEDSCFDERGAVDVYLVLKRNDPGLLWLAKSILETCVV